jgi:hypothetical protein
MTLGNEILSPPSTLFLYTFILLYSYMCIGIMHATGSHSATEDIEFDLKLRYSIQHTAYSRIQQF